MPLPQPVSRDERPAAARLLLIGGDPAAALARQALLEDEGYEVRHMSLAEEGIGLLSRWEPHLIMLCLQVADMDGGDLCRTIRERYPYPILALTKSPDERVLVRALDQGADDVLIAPLSDGELKARVRALLRRARTPELMGPQVVCGGLHIDGARRRATLNGEPVSLTRTEFDILLFLAVRPDTVQRQETILRAVWGPYHGQYVQTLRVHIGHIRRKIEKDPTRPQFIETVPGIGYRFAGAHTGHGNAYRTAHQ